MSRVITAAEVAAYQKFAAENNIQVEGAVGETNATTLATYLDVQMSGATVNQENLTKALTAVRSQIVFVDAREVEYTRVYNSLSEGEQRVFASWWGAQKRFETQGLPGAENAAIILGWMKARRYEVTHQGLDQAVQNIVSNPGRKLHLTEVPTVTFTPGRHSGKVFDKKEEDDRVYVNGKLNHSKVEKTVEASFSPSALDKQWEAKAESVAGKSHSQTAQAKRLLITKRDGTPDWHATYDARVKFLESRNGERF